MSSVHDEAKPGGSGHTPPTPRPSVPVARPPAIPAPPVMSGSFYDEPTRLVPMQTLRGIAGARGPGEGTAELDSVAEDGGASLRGTYEVPAPNRAEQTAPSELRRALSAEQARARWGLGRAAAVAAVVVVVAAGVTLRARHRSSAGARLVVKSIDRGDIVQAVQATGAVQPLLQVNVGAQVNGRVKEVLVDFNSLVRKGDLLAVIDPSIYDTQVNAQEANVLAQRAQANQAAAQAYSSKAQFESARASYRRTQSLFDARLASQSDLDASKSQFQSARGAYEAAKAGAAGARASISAQGAQLKQTLTNLEYTKIYSPIDGIVVTRSIDPGATVVASFQAPVLFVIAQDLKTMRILADIDEADVGKLREGMEVEAVVDAFPGETFRGSVSQVRISPNNVQGVVTYSAVVEVANPEEKLRPGMTATVTIRTNGAKDVLRVPNAALRYKPSGAGSAGVGPAPKGTGRIYLAKKDARGDDVSELRSVSIGITDGINTALRDDSLAGMNVIVDEKDPPKKAKLF